MSLPFRLRWLALRHPRVLDVVLTVLLQRVAAGQRRVARGLDVPGRLHAGAVSFTQYFGSTLQPTPHLHVLCPDGVFTEADDGAVRFVPLPPPTPEGVARIATSVARRVVKALDSAGLLDVDAPPDDEVEALRAHALQASLPFAAEAQALERLCRYGARGPLAEERLSRRDDGRYEYRLRRPAPNGATALVLTAGQLVRRLATLLPFSFATDGRGTMDTRLSGNGCLVVRPDAGVDGGEPDAGTPDAGEADAGEPDAGTDAGSTDGDVPDSGDPQPGDSGTPPSKWDTYVPNDTGKIRPGCGCSGGGAELLAALGLIAALALRRRAAR